MSKNKLLKLTVSGRGRKQDFTFFFVRSCSRHQEVFQENYSYTNSLTFQISKREYPLKLSQNGGNYLRHQKTIACTLAYTTWFGHIFASEVDVT